MSGSWRDNSAPIIGEVIRRVGRDDLPALRRALREAYPYGERKGWPYKAWCAEVRHQLGRPLINRRPDPGAQRELLDKPT